jgi:predicted AAA+ superfamily ATPase
MKIVRALDLKKLVRSKSYFLLGPRQTGKSFLIRENLKKAKIYNLLQKDTFLRLNLDQTLIRKELKPSDKLIVIDEIQKIPELLDEVHSMIEEAGLVFLLTGSSARKLHKSGANMLGGRARIQYFHPLTLGELGPHFDLNKVLNRGLLPSIYFSDDPASDLKSYIALYLDQEIAREGLVRNLPAFSRFLEVAALCNAEQVDFTAIANDAQVKRTTVHEYFQILKDTLIIHELDAWQVPKKRKPVATSKFYFFDWGVVKQLQGAGTVKQKSPLFGKAFETYIFHELKAFCDYNPQHELHYWRTQQQQEVDFILDGKYAIEIKSSPHISSQDISGLIALSEEKIIQKYFIIYTGDSEQSLGPNNLIQAIPYKKFLTQILPQL